MSLKLHNLKIWEKPNISIKLELKQVLNPKQLKLGFSVGLMIVHLENGERSY